jgi:succinate dehydrogenase / fumarate reductase cytochrome b subunit
MALTGSVFVAFVAFHMAGNLKVFLGAEDFNHYARWLRTLLNPLVPGSGFLWLFRAVLVACLVLHVYSGLTIWIRARRARGIRGRKTLVKRISSRNMIWTGLILLCFIVFHILDLTLGTRPAASSEFVADEAYNNLVASFERPSVALFYCLAMVLLAFHLSHGIWSLVNDFGATSKRLRSFWFIFAGAVALVIVLGNLSIPIAVQAGIVTAV